jgi:hypothetical protein
LKYCSKSNILIFAPGVSASLSEFKAALNGDLDVLEALGECDLTAKNEFGQSARYLAEKSKHLDIARTLPPTSNPDTWGMIKKRRK